MICPNCKLILPDVESQHHVCQSYLAAQSLPRQESPQPSHNKKSQGLFRAIGSATLRTGRRVKTRYVFAGIGLLLAVIASFSLGFYQNNRASELLHKAKANIAKGEFGKAESELNAASKYFALSRTKNDIKTTKAQNTTWISLQKKLDEATTLVGQDRLDEAEKFLAQIDKRFPVYAKVTDLLKEISRKKALAAEAKAEAEANVAKQAPPKRAAESSFKQPPSSPPSGCYQINGISTRSTSDRTDDNSGSQMHIVYALPSDGSDQNYDTNGRIASSVSAFQNWLCNQTGGRTLRLDTYQGSLDVTFVRFTSSDTTIRTGAELPYSTNPNSNPYVREDIEIRLNNLGLNQANKIYLVYYEGSSNYACGGASWPPSVSGHSVAMYLKGDGCTGNQLSSGMGYWEFAMLHDSLHTLGAVATCAPHHTLSGHVSDGNNDLMYSGSQPWYPSALDNGHDDYYNHSNVGCFDLADSSFLSS